MRKKIIYGVLAWAEMIEKQLRSPYDRHNLKYLINTVQVRLDSSGKPIITVKEDKHD